MISPEVVMVEGGRMAGAGAPTPELPAGRDVESRTFAASGIGPLATEALGFPRPSAACNGILLVLCQGMVIDTCTFNDLARHLYGVSEGLLDGMRKVVVLNPDLPVSDQQRLRAEWLDAVDAFVRVNQEVLTLAELLRALLAANNANSEAKPALS